MRGDLNSEENQEDIIDLGRIPIEEVFERLKCTRQGLSSAEGAKRLQELGPNKLQDKKERKVIKFVRFMWNPLSWAMEFAALMAILLSNGGGRPPNWQDFVGIVCLLLINSIVTFHVENHAAKIVASLVDGLAPKTKLLRDGKWSEQDATTLVPGDIISIRLGDVIPADSRLFEGDPLKVDQSSITGESIPVTKKPGDMVCCGSICKHGASEAVVIATGNRSFSTNAAFPVDTTSHAGHSRAVLTAIGNFCICFIVVGMLVEIIVMYLMQHRKYRDGLDNLLILLIEGIPIAMPAVLSVTMATGSQKLCQQGAITKRMTAIGEMAGMDVLCINKNGTLTLNSLKVDKKMIKVFAKGVDKENLILLAARASRVINHDAIDAAIIGLLAAPKQARAGIKEVHFLAFNSVDKRAALTYIDSDGSWHRVTKGAPEQILSLCDAKEHIRKKVHAVIENFSEHGLQPLAVARQEVPAKTILSSGGPWEFVGLLPLLDPLRHDSADTISQALSLGVCVKVITGDQLAIAKETCRKLGIGSNVYPFNAPIGSDKDSNIAGLPVEELIVRADGFASVTPENKYEIVKKLQDRKHVVGTTANGVSDIPAIKKADIGIAVSDASDAVRSASHIVLTEPGLSAIISAVLSSRTVFHRMKSYTIYAVCTTVYIVFSFMLIALVWKFKVAPFMVLIVALLNDGTIMTISKDPVKPSVLPESWKLKEIFVTGIILGGYLALITVIFFWLVTDTGFFVDQFGVKSLKNSPEKVMAALYLQVSIASQAPIFVIRSRKWSYMERPGILLLTGFFISQLVATLIAVYADWQFVPIKGVGWHRAGVIWLYNIVFYVPLDIMKFTIQYILSGRAWLNLLENNSAFTSKKGYGKDKSEASSFWYPSKVLDGGREDHRQDNEIASEEEDKESNIDLEEARTERQTMEMFIEHIQKEKPVRFSSQEIESFTWNYSMKIGSGGFGEVYKGEFPNGMPVAIKVLYNNGIDKRVEEQFMAELGTIWRTYHRNLVRLYGFCFDAKTKALVYEYLENGSLDKLLFGKQQKIEWGRLYEIAIGAAEGLEYMHHHSHKRIIHYDIKPGNVLLDSSYFPKIADFGLAKLCNKDSSLITFSGARGTPGYAAPELWLPFPITCKCDVYSFGMMLFEIIGRRRNLDINLSESQEWFPKRVWDKLEKGELEEILVDSGIEEKDMKKSKTMCLVALWCVQYLPDARPFMSDVVRYLEGGVEIQAPPNPFKHLVSSDAPLPSCSNNSLMSTVDTEISEDGEDNTPVIRKYEIEDGSSSC